MQWPDPIELLDDSSSAHATSGQARGGMRAPFGSTVLVTEDPFGSSIAAEKCTKNFEDEEDFRIEEFFAREAAVEIVQDAARSWFQRARILFSQDARQFGATVIQAAWRGFHSRRLTPPQPLRQVPCTVPVESERNNHVSCTLNDGVDLPETRAFPHSPPTEEAEEEIDGSARNRHEALEGSCVMKCVPIAMAITSPLHSHTDEKGNISSQDPGIKRRRKPQQLRRHRTTAKTTIHTSGPSPLRTAWTRTDALEMCGKAAWQSACTRAVLSFSDMASLAGALNIAVPSHDAATLKTMEEARFSLPLREAGGGRDLEIALTDAFRALGVNESHLPITCSQSGTVWVAIAALITGPFGSFGPEAYLARHEGALRWSPAEVRTYLASMKVASWVYKRFLGKYTGMDVLSLVLRSKGGKIMFTPQNDESALTSLMHLRLNFHLHFFAWIAVWEKMGNAPGSTWLSLRLSLAAIVPGGKKRPNVKPQKDKASLGKKEETRRLVQKRTNDFDGSNNRQSGLVRELRSAVEEATKTTTTTGAVKTSINPHTTTIRDKRQIDPRKNSTEQKHNQRASPFPQQAVVIPHVAASAEDSKGHAPPSDRVSQGAISNQKRPLYRPRTTDWAAGQGRVLWSGEVVEGGTDLATAAPASNTIAEAAMNVYYSSSEKLELSVGKGPSNEKDPIETTQESRREPFQALEKGDRDTKKKKTEGEKNCAFRKRSSIALAINTIDFTACATDSDVRKPHAHNADSKLSDRPSWRPAGAELRSSALQRTRATGSSAECGKGYVELGNLGEEITPPVDASSPSPKIAPPAQQQQSRPRWRREKKEHVGWKSSKPKPRTWSSSRGKSYYNYHSSFPEGGADHITAKVQALLDRLLPNRRRLATENLDDQDIATSITTDAMSMLSGERDEEEEAPLPLYSFEVM